VPLPAAAVLPAKTAMEAVLHSAAVVGLAREASRVADSPAVTRLVAFRVVTEAAEAADKSQSKLI